MFFFSFGFKRILNDKFLNFIEYLKKFNGKDDFFFYY